MKIDTWGPEGLRLKSSQIIVKDCEFYSENVGKLLEDCEKSYAIWLILYNNKMF